jgi:hypothetical protein
VVVGAAGAVVVGSGGSVVVVPAGGVVVVPAGGAVVGPVGGALVGGVVGAGVVMTGLGCGPNETVSWTGVLRAALPGLGFWKVTVFAGFAR